MAKIVALFNGRANEVQDAELTYTNGEYVATFADGHFLKFPTHSTDGKRIQAEDFRATLKEHNELNKPFVTEDMLTTEQKIQDEFLESL